MYSEQSSKVDGPALSMDFGGRGRNGSSWRDNDRRSGPYTPRLKYSPADPEAPGKWSHDLFGQQVEGGNLAYRLKMDPGSSAAEAKIAARNGGARPSGGRGGGGGGRDLMDASFDLHGRERKQQPQQQQQQERAPRQAPAAQAAKPTKSISILGSSGKTWVLVANLVAGTTAEDVKTTFEQFGEIIAAKSTPAPRDTVSVLLQFEQYAAAQEAIKTFDQQIADGRPISVALHQPPAAAAPRRQAPPAPAPVPSSAPSKTALGARIGGGNAGGGGGGLFERLGLPAIGGQASRSAPPPPASTRAGRSAGFAEGGDLMDMFGDSKMRSEQDAGESAQSSNVTRGRGGRGRGSRSYRGGNLASRVRGVGGMDVD